MRPRPGARHSWTTTGARHSWTAPGARHTCAPAPHKHTHTQTHTAWHTCARTHAHVHAYSHTHMHCLGSMPPGIRTGMAKIFISRLRGYLGLRLIFMKFRHRDGSAKVRYITHLHIHTPAVVHDTYTAYTHTHTHTPA
jgi:hypothetical protein